MTTLIVQTAGAIVPNANTYLDVSSSNTLAAEYGLTSWVSYAGDKTVALFLAAQYLETVYGPVFLGYLTEDTQPMSFPRTDFTKNNGMLVSEGEIPTELTLAQLKLAIQSSEGLDLFAPPSSVGNLSELSQEVVDGVKQTKKWFSPNTAISNPKYQIGVILSPILTAFSSRTIRA